MFESKSTESLTKDQIAEFHEAFALFDKDGDGIITTKELGTVMRALRYNPTDTELSNYINELDDCNGVLDFQDFLSIMVKKMNNTEDNTFEEIVSALRVFDTTGDGFISVSSLKHAMLPIGESTADDDINEMIKHVYVNDDGMINIEDLVRSMM